jgi:hypothetical protein
MPHDAAAYADAVDRAARAALSPQIDAEEAVAQVEEALCVYLGVPELPPLLPKTDAARVQGDVLARMMKLIQPLPNHLAAAVEPFIGTEAADDLRRALVDELASVLPVEH